MTAAPTSTAQDATYRAEMLPEAAAGAAYNALRAAADKAEA